MFPHHPARRMLIVTRPQDYDSFTVTHPRDYDWNTSVMYQAVYFIVLWGSYKVLAALYCLLPSLLRFVLLPGVVDAIVCCMMESLQGYWCILIHGLLSNSQGGFVACFINLFLNTVIIME